MANTPGNGSTPGTPLVSVAMPVYNGARFVGAAIESVLAQTFTDFEVVIVDDHSTDDSASIISRFNDPRIRIFHNETNLGMAGNWNRSVTLTRGRYVTMFHQDDRMLPENLARKVAVLQGGGRRWVASDCFQIGPDDEPLHEHWFRHRVAMAVADRSRFLQFAAMFFHSNYICFTTIMWERGLMEESGIFTEEAKYCADTHMWLRMLHRARLCYLDERLTEYRWAQNLSMRYKADDWFVADFLARRVASRDLDLAWPYALGLRAQYSAGFARRFVAHWWSGRRRQADRMLEGLRSALS
jgi:glycosyltransferase involved in cell wall biosynthesis